MAKATLKGTWLAAELVFCSKDGRHWYALPCLKEKAPGIHGSTWSRWAFNSCPDQNPSVNGGRLRSELVVSARGSGLTRVWLAEDVNPIVGRRQEPIRWKVPGVAGEWVDDDTWEDGEYGTCHTDQKLLVHLAERGDQIARRTFKYWREKGWLRYRHIPRRKRPAGGPSRIYVSCRQDALAILARRKSEREAAEQAQREPVPAGWKDFAGMCRLHGFEKSKAKRISGDILALSIALRMFRSERPKSATHRAGWDEKRNRATGGAWYYDPTAWRRWLAGRDIRELAAAERNARTPKTETRAKKQLHLAVRFLQFTLTQIRYPASGEENGRPPRFPVKRFRRFLRMPPVGGTLQPLKDGVRAQDIRAWAKQIGLSAVRGKDGPLSQAKAILGAEHYLEGKTHTWYWRLPGPVTIEASEFDGGSVERAAVDAASVAKQSPKAVLPERSQPRWDRAAKKLWLGDQLLKQYGRQPARDQIELIEAVDEEGWPATSVDNPFMSTGPRGQLVPDRDKLREVCKNLNRCLPSGTIQFRRDGSGKICWVYV